MKNKLQAFLTSQAAAGLSLMAAAALAIVAANSPLASAYTTLQNMPLLGHTFTYWTNDALMALFFLLVGLELKRELAPGGQLATLPQRVLPTLCALGGMAVPALIYLALNFQNPASVQGWAIPTATDIAFALGIISLVPRVPLSLKVFLTALAILDDLGAILIIALAYTDSLALTPLLLAAILTACLITFNRSGVRTLWPYLATGALLWLCVYQSGLHATLAGVILAFTVPLATLPKLEHKLHTPVSFLVLPLFGFLNAGIPLYGLTLQSFTHPVTLGIILGLFIGKQLGIGGSLALAAYLRIPLPAKTTALQLYATTLLCGIGFTMSLFIATLAFNTTYTMQTRLGILTASILSASLGYAILRWTTSPRPLDTTTKP